MVNLSLFYHRNVGIYPSAYSNSIRCLPASTGNHQPCRSESIDNLSTYPRNPSMGAPSLSQNRPIIDQLILVIDRSGQKGELPEYSDNLLTNGRNLPPANRQIFVRGMFGIVSLFIGGTMVIIVTIGTSAKAS